MSRMSRMSGMSLYQPELAMTKEPAHLDSTLEVAGGRWHGGVGDVGGIDGVVSMDERSMPSSE